MRDVTIIGAGLAGLQLARLLARGGASVLLVDARRTVTQSVRTTGIFVRRTIEDFASIHPFLGAPIRAIGVHSPAGRTIELAGEGDEFRVGRMRPLYAAMLQQAIAAGAQWLPETAYAGVDRRDDHCEVQFRDGRRVATRFLAGADGAHSRVGRDLQLDQNTRWITGVEHVFPSASGTAPRFDVWVDPWLAPGYLAWLVDDGEEIHAGVGGHRHRFDPVTALRAFEERLRNEERLGPAAPVEKRGGLIPVNGILRRIGNRHGVLVGDAAGAVSPLTAGGLDACMRLSAHAASVLLQGICRRAALDRYDGAAFRSRFASRLAMRWTFDLASRSRSLIELGFGVAQTAVARHIVRHVFFGRGSFPEVALTRAAPAIRRA
ncbi:MAG TPA: NAD(P)/FAD-dependent oxidoreductase [Thermoanaerobaculia bacterium]|nr:NAD(P)/FAD-dependent oxidoreductase [Thermoanaerobaculia bacterium]